MERASRGREVTWLEFLRLPIKQCLSDQDVCLNVLQRTRTVLLLGTLLRPGTHHSGQTYLYLLPYMAIKGNIDL